MKKYWWIVGIGGALVVALAGLLVWQNNYRQSVGVQWAQLQKCCAELDGAIASGGCDFADVKSKSMQLKSAVDATSRQFQTTSIPFGLGVDNFYFLDYLGKTSKALDSICTNCDTWSQVEMSRLKQAAQDMRDAQTECAVRLHLSSNNNLFVQLPTMLNKMHDRLNKQSAPPTPATPAVTVSLPVDPFTASYVTQMRSIIGRYKDMRHSLQVFVSSVSAGGDPMNVPTQTWLMAARNPSFQAGIDGRNELMAELRELSAPQQYQQFQGAIYQAILGAREAMLELQRSGNYGPLHQVSASNGALMDAIKHY